MASSLDGGEGLVGLSLLVADVPSVDSPLGPLLGVLLVVHVIDGSQAGFCGYSGDSSDVNVSTLVEHVQVSVEQVFENDGDRLVANGVV